MIVASDHPDSTMAYGCNQGLSIARDGVFAIRTCGAVTRVCGVETRRDVPQPVIHKTEPKPIASTPIAEIIQVVRSPQHINITPRAKTGGA
jgi:hypothetical protein